MLLRDVRFLLALGVVLAAVVPASISATVRPATAASTNLAIGRPAVASPAPTPSTPPTAAATAASTTTSGSAPASAPRFVQSALASSRSLVASYRASFAGPVTAGNLVLVAISTRNSTNTALVTAVTDSCGNVYARAVEDPVPATAGPVPLSLWYAANVCAGPSFAVSATLSSPGSVSVAAHEYAGAATASVIDQAAHTAATGTSATSGTVATTSANDLLFAAATFSDKAKVNATAGPSYTLRQAQPNGVCCNPLFTEDASASSSGPYAASFLFSRSVNYRVVLAAVRADSGPAVTATATATAQPSSTPTWSATAAPASPTSTRSPAATAAATATPTSTSTPTATQSPTATPSGAGPQIQNLSAPTSGSKYGRSEWVFDLSRTYANPYYAYDPGDTPAVNPSAMSWTGSAGVSVDMRLTAPSGATLSVPAFWDEEYLRVQASGLEVLGRTDGGRWHVRFAPAESGTYSYYLSAQDASGSTRYPASGTLALAVGTSASKGFLHTSATDPRLIAYDSGQPFVPVAAGRQWWNDQAARSYDYEAAFSTDSQNGINLVRVWDQADFALGVEGAQPVWLQQGTTYGPAQGVEINSSRVHTGLRAARPATGNGWYQRLALAQPSQPYQLSAWIRTDSLGGQATVSVTAGTAFGSGTVLGQLSPVTGTTGWTLYTSTFVPGAQVVSLNLGQSGSGGTSYFDDVAFGPVDGSGALLYNAVSDPGFERHFAKDNPGNDPNANPSLPRPLGNYINPWAAKELDAIVDAAERNGVALQLCSCSGPWFTWPQNPSDTVDADWAQPWLLKSWQRNFRYRVARWGASPAILAWELFNEHGNIPPGSSLYAFYQAYGAYQKATDPYHHLRTTSQGSQNFSPALWSSAAFDLANYHDYMMPSRYPTDLVNDEARFVYRYAWCLRSQGSYCSGLAGDGTAWSGGPKPWVWGEIGVGTSVWNVPNLAGTQGEGGRRALHNEMWAGLFSPLATTPIDWYWQSQDSFATSRKLAERKIASQFFSGLDYPGGQVSYLMTASDAPTGYGGETVGTTDATARVLAMRRSDRGAAYLWVQNRNHTWANAAFTPTPIDPTVSLGGLLSRPYTVEIWSPYTGALLSAATLSPTNGTLSFTVSALTDDVAVKIH